MVERTVEDHDAEDADPPEQVEAALAKAGGNQSAAARLLGVSRDTLRYRMEKYGIQRP